MRSFLCFLLLFILMIGCQSSTILERSDTRPSAQAGLTITSSPSGLNVKIDGESMGVTPFHLGGDMMGPEPGERRVVISNDGGFTLEIVKQGQGTVSRSPDLELYSIFWQEDQLLIEEGETLVHHVAFALDEVELLAEAQAGWSFGEWREDLVSSENPATLTMDTDKRITAVFTYSVSGIVEDGLGHSIEGIEISFSGGYSSVTTGSDGGYSKSGLNGSVTVTPSKDGYDFIPGSREVSGPSTEVDFTGGYGISGSVVDGAGNGIGGVELSFSGGYSSVTTGSDGAYSKGGLSGSVIVTPSKDGYDFTPGSREVSGPSTQVDFTCGYDISGSIVDGAGNGIGGVELSFSGGYGTVTTGSDGAYSKGGLSGSVTVTPSKGAYTFNPPSREVTGADSSVDFTGTPPPEAGDRTSHTVEGINFYMRLAPASTFPTGTGDSGSATVDDDFWVAETQVTYELWFEVRMWALDNGYSFANAGREGSHGDTGEEPSGRKNEPVTRVNWYDSIVWCNALSEYLGYNPVYTIDGDVIKSATGIDHTDVVAEDRDGFRLPTSMEWELAARYKGSDSSHGAIEYPAGSGNYWTPGNYASGATADYNNAAATQAAAWYGVNSGGKTQDVEQKPSGGNGLGAFDMSGNVWEWCFTQSESNRVIRGSSWWLNYASFLRVGYDVFSSTPGNVSHAHGFRFLRTHF